MDRHTKISPENTQNTQCIKRSTFQTLCTSPGACGEYGSDSLNLAYPPTFFLFDDRGETFSFSKDLEVVLSLHRSMELCASASKCFFVIQSL